MKEDIMKKETAEFKDELRPEYDFAAMPGGVQGKYARQYQHGTNLVLLAPDVAEVFTGTEAVNEALRALIGIARNKVPKVKTKANK